MNKEIINENMDKKRTINCLTDYLFEQSFLMDKYVSSSKGEFEIFFECIYDSLYNERLDKIFIDKAKLYISECIAISDVISIDSFIDNLNILIRNKKITESKVIELKKHLTKRYQTK